MLYFAYGSNLSAADWRLWCGQHGHDPESIEYLRPARLEGHALEFSLLSSSRGGGVLNVRRQSGRTAWGGLFRVTPAGLAALDHKEAVGRYYERLEVEVSCSLGQSHRVWTYSVLPRLSQRLVEPAPAYVEIVRQAIKSLGIDPAGFEAAVRQASTKPSAP